MANDEHVGLLKQGVNVWNAWRKKYPDVKPDLHSEILSNLDLSEVNLKGADMIMSDLSGSNLSKAKISDANLSMSNLSGTNLSEATLFGTNLEDADLTDSDCRGTNLRYAKFIGTKFVRAILNEATFSATVLANVDLCDVSGLDTCRHEGPSLLDHRTLQNNPHLPHDFLRGCGLGDLEIEIYKLYRQQVSNQEIVDITYRIYDLRAHRSIQINPLFISYSSADSDFVDYLEPHLISKGIRYWRDTHHAVAGRIESQVDRAIRLNPTVLLILSQHSIESDWVEHEARLARSLERESQRDVICPISLDKTWESCRWPARLREQIMEYNILDFSQWQDNSKFDRMLSRLLDGLDLFYKVK